MALTNEEKQERLNAMKADSQSVDNLEVVGSLDGVKSLPAVRGEELVAAPLNLLSKPAQDAAATANSAAATANEAAAKAIEAADNASNKAASIDSAVTKANNAAKSANAAAKYADEKAGVADIAAKNADATVSELKQLSTDFVGKTMGVPTEMRLEYLKEISLRNDVPQRIKVSLIPSYYPQNFIFQFVEGDGIRVDPGGNIRLIKEGVTSLWVIPLGNTSLWQEISIRVKQPEMRLVDASSFRIVDGVFRI